MTNPALPDSFKFDVICVSSRNKCVVWDTYIQVIAICSMQIIDVDKFDVICVSPRNHFVFTPMLPATAVGSVEPRSLLEPVRLANEYLAYFEANAESIDLEAKTATCMSIVSKDPKRRVEFQVDYDTLFVAVGEVRHFCRTLW